MRHLAAAIAIASLACADVEALLKQLEAPRGGFVRMGGVDVNEALRVLARAAQEQCAGDAKKEPSK